MHKGRLEAFSDAVIAIAMTVMVLELKEPHTADIAGLWAQAPVLSAYLLSFVFLGIYWSNHHHMFQAVEVVNGAILWANLHLLFWLSIVPFFTAWMGSSGYARVPVSAYGFLLVMCAVSYTILVRVIVASGSKNAKVAEAVGSDRKGTLSLVIYLASVVIAQFSPLVACGCFVLVACIWLVPDRRFEKVLHAKKVE